MFPIGWWNFSRRMSFKTKPLYRRISSTLKWPGGTSDVSLIWVVCDVGHARPAFFYVVGEGLDFVSCIPHFLSRWAVFQSSTAHAVKVPKSAKSDSFGCAQIQVDLHPSIRKAVSGKSTGAGLPLMYPCSEASLPVLSSDGYGTTKISF